MGKPINSSFPGLSLVLSEIFKSELKTIIHYHNLTETDNSKPKGYIFGAFSGGSWSVCQFSKATLDNQNIHAPLDH